MKEAEFTRLGIALSAVSLAAGHEGAMVSENISRAMQKFSNELRRRQGRQIYRVMVSELHSSSEDPEKVAEIILLIGSNEREVVRWCDQILRDEETDDVTVVRFGVVFTIIGGDMNTSLQFSSPDKSLTDLWGEMTETEIETEGVVSIERKVVRVAKEAKEDEEEGGEYVH